MRYSTMPESYPIRVEGAFTPHAATLDSFLQSIIRVTYDFSLFYTNK